jgi:serine/threonine-protein kinase HipA
VSDRTRQLAVVLGGRRIGTVVEDAGGYRFTYEAGYRQDPTATPLSLSMPVLRAHHEDGAVRPFLWGLLPDNEQVIQRWARTYQVSPNPFALLAHVGADCAGAAQFIPPDEVDAVLAGEGGIDWVDDEEIARRLRTLRTDPTAWHLSATGQFSLAGAQAKTAMYVDPETGAWGDPRGATPTTHIIKPAVTGLDDHDLNEHLCLRAASALGLRAADSAVVTFAGERAIAVERYDRLRTRDGAVLRVHQEDMCQALGLPPTAKYQNEGGPSPERIVELLDGREGAHFLDALAFNWVIAGTDAHAKNYSVLLSGPQVRLAPMYDVASALPYDNLYLPKLKMAMRIGGQYAVGRIGRRQWDSFAGAVGLDPEEVRKRVDTIAEHAADAFLQAARGETVTALRSDLPTRLVDRVAAHAKACREALAQR